MIISLIFFQTYNYSVLLFGKLSHNEFFCFWDFDLFVKEKNSWISVSSHALHCICTVYTQNLCFTVLFNSHFNCNVLHFLSHLRHITNGHFHAMHRQNADPTLYLCMGGFCPNALAIMLQNLEHATLLPYPFMHVKFKPSIGSSGHLPFFFSLHN